MLLMHKRIFSLFIILAFIFSIFGCGKVVKNDTPVKNLKAIDVPNDDGGGIILSWTPLPNEKKIIEYRVYRGISPDTLYYIGRIPINVKAGVSADTLKYYNKGYTFFMDANSPKTMKLEKGQKKGEPKLYRRVPKDLSIAGPLFEHYKMLCVIPKKEYYYKTKEKEFVDTIRTEDGKIDTTRQILAGLKINQFRGIYAKLRPGHKYYYAVQAVNNRRQRSPVSDVVEIAPTDEPPERLKDFYAVNVSDKDKMHFEWTNPFFSSDQKQFNIYLIDNGEKHLIFSRTHAYPYTPQTNAIVTYDNIRTKYNDFESKKMAEYRFDIGLVDRAGNETFYTADEQGIEPEIITADQLPEPVKFLTIDDNPNDEGEQNRIYFGYPYAGITKAEYSNDFKKLSISYYYNDNEHYKVKSINFFTNGVKHTEYVLDKVFKVKVKGWNPETDPVNIRISFNAKTGKGMNPIPEDYTLSYTIKYNKAMEIAEVINNDTEKNYNYQVYKLNRSSEVYRYPKLIPYNWRVYLDKVSYEEYLYRGINKYDKDYIYSSAYLYLERDNEKEKDIYCNLYLSQIKNDKKEYQKEINRLNKILEDDKKLEDEVNEELKDENSTLSRLEEEKELTFEELKEKKRERIKEAIEKYTKAMNGEEDPEYLKLANQQTSDDRRIRMLSKISENNSRTFKYYLRKTDGKGHFIDTECTGYIIPEPNWFSNDKVLVLLWVLIFGGLVFYFIKSAQRGKEFYIRSIAGIQEIDNAIGRATEMGRPILYVPGLSGITDVATLAGLAILSKVAKKAAEYETKILVPCRDYIVLPIAQEIVKEAHYEAGRPDTYDRDSVFFITSNQFAFVAGVNGIMIREKTATNFYMGMFWAESLLLTETGNTTGAIQIAGTDAVTQLPFFITTCDYTLIGEELYAAGAYLSRQPLIMGTLKAQDYAKLLIVICIIAGTFFSTINLTFFMNLFPEK
ncbi:MAG: hypothetical protein DRH57_08320 [Candidatus Cloacimonadota bacterium]|nr:MAG: hypothetical protein DRH57_08320 [Candidatus Cloacimonadota bacterium]